MKIQPNKTLLGLEAKILGELASLALQDKDTIEKDWINFMQNKTERQRRYYFKLSYNLRIKQYDTK